MVFQVDLQAPCDDEGQAGQKCYHGYTEVQGQSMCNVHQVLCHNGFINILCFI